MNSAISSAASTQCPDRGCASGPQEEEEEEEKEQPVA